MNKIEDWLIWERDIPDYIKRFAAIGEDLTCGNTLDILLKVLSEGRTGLDFEYDRKSQTIKSNYDKQSPIVNFPLSLDFVKEFYDSVVDYQNYLSQ